VRPPIEARFLRVPPALLGSGDPAVPWTAAGLRPPSVYFPTPLEARLRVPSPWDGKTTYVVCFARIEVP